MLRLLLFINIVILPATVLAAEGGGHAPDFMGLVWRIIVFAVFVFIIYKFAKNPLLNFLDNRSSEIEKSIENAEKAKEEAEIELTNYKLKLQQMESELETMKERSRKQAESEKEKIIEDAKSDIEKLKKSTENMIKSDLDKAKSELREETARLALKIAENKVEKELKDDVQKKLVKNYISKMGVVN